MAYLRSSVGCTNASHEEDIDITWPDHKPGEGTMPHGDEGFHYATKEGRNLNEERRVGNIKADTRSTPGCKETRVQVTRMSMAKVFYGVDVHT